ncbi:ATP-dependent nuclease [Phaeobacter inhibens]|uniref:ATP-dependent nuclease n=1 Tax=Phaeobacter inhibens TaxID=221822 RepID=UPI0021A563D6|nr:ATP-binding protein [Phaeobacter inhibens]UWR73181.1 ATP-binding protein [Phaeobacter inhibens]
MYIAHISISEFRGIKSLEWSPSPSVNCMIGPGDSCKTTILDAIEIGLSPRFGYTGSDPDLFGCDPSSKPEICLTLVDLPDELILEQKYGLYLRGWNAADKKVNDEKADGDQTALTVKALLDPETLEWRWEVFNERLEGEPPRFGFKDAKSIAPNRLGEYADRHLTWGRNSVLGRLEKGPNASELLASSVRQAKASFAAGDRTSFDDVVKLTEKVGADFLVPKAQGYEAQLDIHAGMLASGAVSLHDGNMPLRTLGSGSSRLMVAGVQNSGPKQNITLVDELELGLEPHRIMRLLRFLRSGFPQEGDAPPILHQTFLTTHSPVVVCELDVAELFCVRNSAGSVAVNCARPTEGQAETAQRHVRSNPHAFLAPRLLIGEGRTEVGFWRGLDDLWCVDDKESFAYQGVVAIDGGGNDNAVKLGLHMQKLGYSCFVLLDTDVDVSEVNKQKFKDAGGQVAEWIEDCDIERRVFLDVPWTTVREIIDFTLEVVGEGRVLNNLFLANKEAVDIDRAALDALADSEANRKWLASAATLKVEKKPGVKEDRSWFKDMTRGEQLGKFVFGCLKDIPETPLAKTINEVRHWVDA